eukprot:Sspe_Gene.5649::Locus_1875_Transcript_1_1_Confidence_1.000_Length_1096::g.5649::m.5649
MCCDQKFPVGRQSGSEDLGIIVKEKPEDLTGALEGDHDRLRLLHPHLQGPRTQARGKALAVGVGAADRLPVLRAEPVVVRRRCERCLHCDVLLHVSVRLYSSMLSHMRRRERMMPQRPASFFLCIHSPSLELRWYPTLLNPSLSYRVSTHLVPIAPYAMCQYPRYSVCWSCIPPPLP